MGNQGGPNRLFQRRDPAGREVENHGRTLRRHTYHGEMTAMTFDQFLGERQPRARRRYGRG